MVRSEDVTFRRVDAEITDVKTGDKSQPMDIIEISRPDGNVAAFPATDVNPESGQRYCDIYADKYRAFMNDPDAERVATVQREIAEREAELETMRNAKKERAASDKAQEKADKAAEKKALG